MWILSWNIQKVTAEKAQAFSKLIGDTVNGTVGDEPFILFVLENRTDEETVMAAIGSGLNASQLRTKSIEMGGSKTLRENVIVIAGNGATFDAPSQFTAWHVPYDTRCAALHLAEKKVVLDHVEMLRRGRPARASVEAQRERLLFSADINTYRKSDTLRNPIQLVARYGGLAVKILALHSPGPSDGQDHTERTAEIFGAAVFATARGFDMVIGDFNLRSGANLYNGFVDQATLLGATTKGKEEGRHVSSRLDRVYVRRGFPITSMLVSDSDDKELTDHHCLVARVDHRPQRLVTDYFQYQPSPRRRQKIGQAGRTLAEKGRSIFGGIDSEVERAKRREEEAELRKQRRLTDMAIRRTVRAPAAAGPAASAVPPPLRPPF